MKYTVTLSIAAFETVEVEATSFEEAEKSAAESFKGLMNMDMDPVEITEVYGIYASREDGIEKEL